MKIPFVNFILDFLFPKEALTKKLESMSPELFLRKAKKSNRKQSVTPLPLYEYRDTLVKRAIWEIKYKKNLKIAKLLGQVLAETLIEEFQDRSLFEGMSTLLLIPIPLSKKRLQERGYNQSELVCKEIESSAGNTFITYRPDILYKTRETPSQTTLKHRGERLKNIAGSFIVKNHELIKNKTIVVFDDVITTGATMAEAIRVLKAAGARKIIPFAIAH